MINILNLAESTKEKKLVKAIIWQPHLQKRTIISYKRYLNLCSWKWLWPSSNLLLSRTPLRLLPLWNAHLLTGVINFKMHFFENTEVTSISNSMSNLFHSVMVDGKEEFGLFLKMVCMFFKRGMYTHILSKIKWWLKRFAYWITTYFWYASTNSVMAI